MKEEVLYLVIYFVRAISSQEIKSLFCKDCMVGEEYNHHHMELGEEYQENLYPCYFFLVSLFPLVYLKFLFPFPLTFYFEIFLYLLERFVWNFLLECFHQINWWLWSWRHSGPSSTYSSLNTSPSCIFVIIFIIVIIIINNFI